MSARADIQAGRAFVSLYVKQNAFTKGLSDAQKRLQSFGADVMAVGRQMVAMSAAPLALGFAAVRQFASFDDAMRSVGAVSLATEKELESMTAVAKELGRTTSFTAVQVASLMGELGRAGFKPDEINEMTDAVLNLARATGTDATQASGIMAATLRQFGLGAGDATRVADAFTQAANGAFVSVEQLGESLSYAGPIANDFGISIEDALAVLGGLGNAGIQASMAGTALRRLLLITGSEAQKLQGIFGVAMVDANGNARPLVDTLTEIQQATKGLGTAAKAAKMEEAFGDLGITAASVIGKGGTSIRDLAAAIRAAGGVSEATAKKMDAGIGGSFRIILSAVEGVYLAIGKALEPAMKRLADTTTEVLGGVVKWIDENRQAVATAMKWTAAIAGMGAALIGVGLAASVVSVSIGGLLAIAGAVKAVFVGLVTVLGTTFAVLTSPVTLIAAALAGIVGAVLHYTGALAGINAEAIKIRDKLSEVFGEIAKTVKDTLGGIILAISSGNMATAGEIAMTGMKIVFLQGMQAISNIVGGNMGALLSTIAGQIANGDMSGAWATVLTTMGTVWETFIGGVISSFAEATTTVVNAWRDAIDAMANMIIEFAGQGGAFGAFFEAITGVDMQAEMERSKKLKAASQAAGMNTQNESADVVNEGRVKNETTNRIADAINSVAGIAAEDAQRKGDAAKQEFNAAVMNAGGNNDAMIAALQAEIINMRAKLAKDIDERNKKPSGSGPGTDGSSVGGSAGGSASVGTFSAQAAILQNMGGMRENPMVKEVREVVKLTRAERRARREEHQEQIRAMRELGWWHD